MRITTTSLLVLLVAFCGYALAQGDSGSYDDLPQAELEARFERAKERKRYEEALDYMEILIKHFPDNAKYLYDSADTLLLAKKYDKAETQFERVLYTDPEYLEAHVGRAIIYIIQKKEKQAKTEMLNAAQKGYPVREVLKIRELRAIMKNNVRFFLDMVGSDAPRVDARVRDPFNNPLQRIEGPRIIVDPDDDGPRPEEVVGDPLQIQRDKSIKMGDLLLLVQQHLNAGDDEEARKAYEEFKSLYHDVELGKITNEKYRKEMINTWELAQKIIYPRLRKIELKAFQEEADIALEKLQEAYRDQDVDAAKQYNDEMEAILKPKLESKDNDFRTRAEGYQNKKEDLFRRVSILEEFQQSVKPFLKLTMTITSSKVNIALIETTFDGELKRATLRKSDCLQRMTDFVVIEIEEERVIATYKDEKVDVPLGSNLPPAPPQEEP